MLDRLAGAPEALAKLDAIQTLRTVVARRYERVDGRLGRRERGPDAASGDLEALPAIRGHLDRRALAPAEQYVDSGYVPGKQLADSAAVGSELAGPPLADTSPAAFKLADFRIERTTRQATCPGGKAAVKWGPRTDRDGSAAINIRFAAADCAACALRPHCTGSRSGRSLHRTQRYERLQARRAEAHTDAFRERTRRRPGIEATLSELVRRHGLRRHRYRGDAKRAFEPPCKGVACDLKRLARALRGMAPRPVPRP